MARIAGVNVPENKHLEIALYIMVLEEKQPKIFVVKLESSMAKKISTLPKRMLKKLNRGRNYTVEGDLRREVSTNIKRLMDLELIEVFAIEENCQQGSKNQN